MFEYIQYSIIEFHHFISLESFPFPFMCLISIANKIPGYLIAHKL